MGKDAHQWSLLYSREIEQATRKRVRRAVILTTLLVGSVAALAGHQTARVERHYAEADYPNDLTITFALTSVEAPEVVETGVRGSMPLSCLAEIPKAPSHEDVARAYDQCIDELHRQAELR